MRTFDFHFRHCDNTKLNKTERIRHLHFAHNSAKHSLSLSLPRSHCRIRPIEHIIKKISSNVLSEKQCNSQLKAHSKANQEEINRHCCHSSASFSIYFNERKRQPPTRWRMRYEISFLAFIFSGDPSHIRKQRKRHMVLNYTIK